MTDQITGQNPEAEVTQPEGASPKANEALEPKQEVKTTPTPEKAPEPQSETISKVEHEKLVKSMKDGHSGTVSQMRQEREALQAKLEELEDKMEENTYQNWLRVLEEKGIDNTDLAKQVVEKDKETRKALRTFEKEKSRILAMKAELDQAAKGKAAYDLAKEYKLDEAVVSSLVTAENEWEMRAKAQALYIEKISVAAQKPESPPEGEGLPKGKDLSKMSDSEKMGYAIEMIERAT